MKTVQANRIALLRQQQAARNGFTLLEVLAVVALFGILAAIAAPSWFSYLNIQRLNAARSEAIGALTQAQTQAKQHHVFYETGFRQQNQQVQWAAYPVGAEPQLQSWKNLNPAIRLLETETTLAKKSGVYRIQFDHYGRTNGQLGRVTFISASGGATKRCAIVSNLLGTIREGENRPRQSGNPCD